MIKCQTRCKWKARPSAWSWAPTRIKAVLIGPDHAVLAAGAHDWENRLEDGYWTYSLDDVWAGVQDAYAKLAAEFAGKVRHAAHVGGRHGRLGHDARLPAV